MMIIQIIMIKCMDRLIFMDLMIKIKKIIIIIINKIQIEENQNNKSINKSFKNQNHIKDNDNNNMNKIFKQQYS